MTDFCLGPQILERIARQAKLMDRMVAWLGVEADAYAQVDARCQARLRCIDCEWSRRCASFLAAPPETRAQRVPNFCANAHFFRHCTAEKTATANLQGGSP